MAPSEPRLAALQSGRLATALTWFGAVGLALSLVMAIALVWGLVALGGVDRGLESDRAAIAVALTDGSRLLAGTATTLEGTTRSLDSVRTTVDDTAHLLGQLEKSTRELAAALRVSILGQRPFAAVAGSFEEIGDQLAVSAEDAAAVVSDMDRLKPDLAGVAGDLRSVEASVSLLAARTNALGDLAGLVAAARLLIAVWALVSLWLATLAAGCVWAGRRMGARR